MKKRGPQIQIRTRPNPDCYVCGARDEPLYQRLRDRLFGAPGEWDLKKCPNPQCGLVWLDPMPVEEDLGKAYRVYFTHGTNEQENIVHGKWDLLLRRIFKYLKHGYLATRYDYKDGVSIIQRISGYGLFCYPFLIRSLNRGVRYVKHVPQGKLLDVGCGDGSYIQYMRVLGWDVKGVDFDPEAVSNARARGLMVQLGDLAQQQYPDNTFDVITINHVIEHVPEPLGLLQECRRILKPDGKLVVATPNASSWGHRLYGPDWRGLEPPRHLHIFTPTSLAVLSEQAGLCIIDLSTRAGSAKLFLASRSIRQAGEAELRGRYPFSMRVWAKGMEIFEGLLNLVKKNAGQELILIASKQK